MAVVASSQDTIEAIQIVCDYLSEALSSKLVAHLGQSESDVFPTRAATTSKRKADWEVELEVEKDVGYRGQPVRSDKPPSAASSSQGDESQSSRPKTPSLATPKSSGSSTKAVSRAKS